MSATALPHSTDQTDLSPDNLTSLLLRAAEQYPNSGVYIAAGDDDDAEFLAYPALLEESRRILGGLQTFALHPHAKIALLLECPRDFIPVFWACVLGGYIPCPLAKVVNDPERRTKHLSYIDTLLDRPLVIGTEESLDGMPSSMRSVRLADLRSGPPHGGIHAARLGDIAVLMLTSGSTGNSKAVELTHGNILASMAAKAEMLGWSSADVALNWVGFDHVAALLKIHMIAMYVGAVQIHVEPAEVLATPLRFIQLIDRYRVTLAFTPNFLFGQINAALEAAASGNPSAALQFDLSRLRCILAGGEANVVQTGLRLLELLAPFRLSRNVLYPAYGLTETCAGIVYSKEFPDCDLEREFASVGKPVRGLELRIADEDGKSLPEGSCGEVQVRGPIVFRGYHNNEAATRDAFTDEGWFRTGDMGRIDAGRLSIVARIKDSIIVSGVNYFSHELETQLQQLEGIERSFVAAFPTRPKGADTEQLVVAFATSLPAADEERLYQLAVAVRNTTIMLWGFRPSVVLPLPQSAFPKTSLGKIQRSLMRKRFESGAYDSEAAHIARITAQRLGGYAAPRDPVESALVKIYSRILGVNSDTLSTRASFFELGGTSLDILKLMQTLDRELGAKIELPTLIQNPSAGQLAAHISLRAHSVAYDPIVPLQTTGKQTPLFCVHPGNSEVLVLVNLAKYFVNDRPFLAFRPRGFHDGERRFESVEEFVDTYIEAILERQPHGPYAIAGYSLGALLAFEITKRLEALGHHVAFLGLIDYRPHTETLHIPFTRIATALAWVLELIDWPLRRQLNEEISSDQPPSDICEQVFRFAGRKRSRLAELNLDLHKYTAWARVAHRTEELLFDRITSGKVRTATVFRSSGAPGYDNGDTDHWHAGLQRWEHHTLQPPRFVDVLGDHFNLMSPKHVAAFQAALRVELERAFAADGSVSTSPLSPAEVTNP